MLLLFTHCFRTQIPKQFRMFRPVKESVVRTLAAAKKDAIQHISANVVEQPAGEFFFFFITLKPRVE